MLVSSQKILLAAQRGKYAVGHFNTSNLEMTRAIIRAAEKLASPVIVGTSEKAIDYAGLEELSSLIQAAAEKVKIPVILHLDHGKSFEIAQKCIKAGYTSLMIDGSDLAFEENILLTKKVVDLGHRFNLAVEGELGSIPKRDDYFKIKEKFYTDPQMAAEFVEKTGVDSLAISIGNAHGIPVPDERLDFNRLAEIRREVSVPLVLHGASQTPPEDIKKAIIMGICKINIDTEIRLAFHSGLKEFLVSHPDVFDPREILGSVMDKVGAIIEEKIKLFGSAGVEEKK
jgi:tagatose 1,6-diphosphate aldolase GatY/KbaY